MNFDNRCSKGTCLGNNFNIFLWERKKKTIDFFFQLFILNNATGITNFTALILYLFRWKILYKDSFRYFSVFGSIRKNELKENYL